MRAASTHTTQRRIGWPRRRARASPSIVASSTGQDQRQHKQPDRPGRDHLAVEEQIRRGRGHVRARLERGDRLQDGAPERRRSGPGWSARRRRARARPESTRAPRARRCRRTGPARWRRAGTRGARTGRRGSRRRAAGWPAAASAAATVLRSIGGATSWRSDHGTTIGWRTWCRPCRRARSRRRPARRALRASCARAGGADRAAGRGEHDRAAAGSRRRARWASSSSTAVPEDPRSAASSQRVAVGDDDDAPRREPGAASR